MLSVYLRSAGFFCERQEKSEWGTLLAAVLHPGLAVLREMTVHACSPVTYLTTAAVVSRCLFLGHRWNRLPQVQALFLHTFTKYVYTHKLDWASAHCRTGTEDAGTRKAALMRGSVAWVHVQGQRRCVSQLSENAACLQLVANNRWLSTPLLPTRR